MPQLIGDSSHTQAGVLRQRAHHRDGLQQRGAPLSGERQISQGLHSLYSSTNNILGYKSMWYKTIIHSVLTLYVKLAL